MYYTILCKNRINGYDFSPLAVYADSINELEVKQVEMEGVESLILQRLASIDAKLELIITSIEKL